MHQLLKHSLATDFYFYFSLQRCGHLILSFFFSNGVASTGVDIRKRASWISKRSTRSDRKRHKKQIGRLSHLLHLLHFLLLFPLLHGFDKLLTSRTNKLLILKKPWMPNQAQIFDFGSTFDFGFDHDHEIAWRGFDVL